MLQASVQCKQTTSSKYVCKIYSSTSRSRLVVIYLLFFSLVIILFLTAICFKQVTISLLSVPKYWNCKILSPKKCIRNTITKDLSRLMCHINCFSIHFTLNRATSNVFLAVLSFLLLLFWWVLLVFMLC